MTVDGKILNDAAQDTKNVKFLKPGRYSTHLNFCEMIHIVNV
jgi:hypothetical protein